MIFVLLLVVTYASFCASFVVHEFGHYIAARLVGITPVSVNIGHFGPAANFTYAGTDFNLHLFSNLTGNHSVKFGSDAVCSLPSATFIIVGGVLLSVIVGCLIMWAAAHFRSVLLLTSALIFIFSGGLAQFVPIGHTDGATLIAVYRDTNVAAQ